MLEQFLPNWHIEVLAAKLEEVRRGSCKRLIVNVPPRHLKSHVDIDRISSLGTGA